jgi:hypothetical protein
MLLVAVSLLGALTISVLTLSVCRRPEVRDVASALIGVVIPAIAVAILVLGLLEKAIS